MICVETLLNIREAEMICKANGWKFVVGSAFDIRITKEYFLKHLGEDYQELIDTIPWDCFVYPAGMRTFMEVLLTLEGKPELAPGGFYDYCKNLKGPTDYVTPCAHPSQNGYAVMAKHLFNFLELNRYVQVDKYRKV